MRLPLLLILALLAIGGCGVQRSSRNVQPGSSASLLPEYDYVVVGCGVAGLTVSMRLSENNVTVLCIEAGPIDQYEEGIQFPFDMGRDVGSQYDWGLNTVGQSQLDGRTRSFPQGRGVGGGSLINGMVWNRGHVDDFRSWESLGNPGWGWDSLLGYFRKSENYTPIFVPGISPQYQADTSTSSWDFHGFEGPVHVSYPKYYWNQTVNLFQALEELNAPIISDPNAGGVAGGYYMPSTMHPTNQTRSDARRAYMDPFIWRPNFNVIYNSQVTRILFQNFSTNVSQALPGDNPSGRGNVTTTVSNIFGAIRTPTPTRPLLRPRQTRTKTPYHATAVEFAENALMPRQTVQARREIIVAAGAIHSPQVLQLSGLGPAALLQRFNIAVAQDLPGVGNNLQDHAYVATDYPYNNESYRTVESLNDPSFNASAERRYRANKTGPWTARVSTAMAFLSLSQITNDSAAIISSGLGAGSASLPPGYESTLRNGYQQQLNILSTHLPQSQFPVQEILTDGAGSFTLTLQHPFSRGYTEIRSGNPFDTPLIDPRWGANPADITTMVRAIEFSQRILGTAAFNVLHPTYHVPHQNAPEPELRSYIAQQMHTEYHPSGTCAMLPRDMGGVVDPQLMVYGTDNLRVVDASIMPLIPGAHLMAPLYAVAEKAADIIKMAAGDHVEPLPAVGERSSNMAWSQWMMAVLGLPGGEETRGEAETW